MGGIYIKGKVIRKIKGFYYVSDERYDHLKEEDTYECKLKGTLKVKNNKMNCIIGDIVDFDEKEKVIIGINERKNFLYRPLLANIDFIGILFSIVSPEFNFNVFQKMLLNASWQNIPAILIISKIDLVEKNTLDEFLNKIKENFGEEFPVFPISTEKNIGLTELKEYIEGKSITVSGPSGVGKSTLINSLIGLTKGTSLAFSAGVVEVFAQAQILGGADYRYFERFISVALVYWVVNIGIEGLGRFIEKKMAISAPDTVVTDVKGDLR